MLKLKEDIGKLKEDLGKLREDTGKLREDIGKLKEEIGKLREDKINYVKKSPSFNPSLSLDERGVIKIQ